MCTHIFYIYLLGRSPYDHVLLLRRESDSDGECCGGLLGHVGSPSLELKLLAREDLNVGVEKPALVKGGGDDDCKVGALGRPADRLDVLVFRCGE